MDATLQTKTKKCLSLSQARLSFLVKNQLRLFLAAFEGFLILGLVKDDTFCKKKCIKISFSNFKYFFEHCVNQVQFLSNIDEKNSSEILNVEFLLFNNVFFTQTKCDNEPIVKYVCKQNKLFTFSFDIIQFFSLINAFKNLLFHALHLKQNQTLFLKMISSNLDIELQNMKNNPYLILKFVQSKEASIILEKYDNYLEIYDYYFDIIMISRKLHMINL